MLFYLRLKGKIMECLAQMVKESNIACRIDRDHPDKIACLSLDSEVVLYPQWKQAFYQDGEDCAFGAWDIGEDPKTKRFLTVPDGKDEAYWISADYKVW